MRNSQEVSSTETANRPNGSGAAAILAAPLGSFALAILALAGDKSAAVKRGLDFYNPTGPLSGVTDVAIVIWLLFWVVLEIRWGEKSVRLGPICAASFMLLGLSFLLTFPPIVDIF